MGLDDVVPTWRNDALITVCATTRCRAQLDLDLALVRTLLGPDVTFLQRSHRFLAPRVRSDSREVVDVTAWPDMSDPLAASDVLVIDCSSVLRPRGRGQADGLLRLRPRPLPQRALEAAPGAVLWLNADVLFTEGFAAQVVTSAGAEVDFIGVARGRTADEEVESGLDERGWVAGLS